MSIADILEIQEQLDKANVPKEDRNVLYKASDGVIYLVPSPFTPEWVVHEFSIKLGGINEIE